MEVETSSAFTWRCFHDLGWSDWAETRLLYQENLCKWMNNFNDKNDEWKANLWRSRIDSVLSKTSGTPASRCKSLFYCYNNFSACLSFPNSFRLLSHGRCLDGRSPKNENHYNHYRKTVRWCNHHNILVDYHNSEVSFMSGERNICDVRLADKFLSWAPFLQLEHILCTDATWADVCGTLTFRKSIPNNGTCCVWSLCSGFDNRFKSTIFVV